MRAASFKALTERLLFFVFEGDCLVLEK